MSCLRQTSGRHATRALAGLLTAAVLLGAGAGAANAEFGIQPDPLDPSRPDFHVAVTDQNGDEFSLAGGRPFAATTSYQLNTRDDGAGPVPDENQRRVVVDLPVGLIGNPQAAPTCSLQALRVTNFSGNNPTNCPIEAQVGLVSVHLTDGSAGPGARTLTVPLYNMTANSNEIAAFAFSVLGVPVRLVPRIRTESDNGVTVTVADINSSIAVTGVRLSLWGVPGDPAHDPERGLLRFTPDGGPSIDIIPGNQPSTYRKPFVSLPVDCSQPAPTTTIAVSSWQQPATVKRYSARTPTGVTRCDQLRFEPTITVRPELPAAASPSGLHIELGVPQDDNAVSRATPPLRQAVVTLPAGMRVSPSSADGLGGCSDLQVALKDDSDPTCPLSSKIGTVTIDTPLLEEPLNGSIYLGTQTPQQLLRLFIVAQGRGGLILKLAGKVDPDPLTGQLTATFDDNPQLPFSRLSLDFKGGSRAALSNPPVCGRYTATARLTSWAPRVAANAAGSFQIDRGPAGGACAPLGFTPSFRAGTTNVASGASTSFAMTLARDDDDQELRDVRVALPPGLTGRIAGADLCADALAAAGACGESSRIGSVTTAAGPGAMPFQLPGRVYISGPYRGAPFGLSIVVPALAGPFDLGTVVVRAAIFVDRRTTSLRVISDPLPSILQGIPLQLRSVNLTIDRAGFMLNPTSCRRGQVTGTVSSLAGAVSAVASRFQAAGCRSLPFSPRMTLRVGARGKTMPRKRTPLVVTLAMPPDNANNRSVEVTLPTAINARLDVVNKRRACSSEQFDADRCPMSVGTATAVTPLLRDPLRGSAYFVYNAARRLPDLVVRLRGQVDVDLVGKVTITRDLRLRTTFDTVPDVPIRTFTLTLASGAVNGPVGLTRNVCAAATRRTLRAELELIGQSGRVVGRQQPIGVAGCGRASRRR